jgi:hypothetical protein
MSLKTKMTLVKLNNIRRHTPQESNRGGASLELLIKEFFISIFYTIDLRSRGKIEG